MRRCLFLLLFLKTSTSESRKVLGKKSVRREGKKLESFWSPHPRLWLIFDRLVGDSVRIVRDLHPKRIHLPSIPSGHHHNHTNLLFRMATVFLILFVTPYPSCTIFRKETPIQKEVKEMSGRETDVGRERKETTKLRWIAQAINKKNRDERKKPNPVYLSQSVLVVYTKLSQGVKNFFQCLSFSNSISLLPKSLPSLRVDSYFRIFSGINIYFKIYNFILGFLQVTIYSSPAPPFQIWSHSLSLSLSFFHIHTLSLFISFPPLTWNY